MTPRWLVASVVGVVATTAVLAVSWVGVCTSRKFSGHSRVNTQDVLMTAAKALRKPIGGHESLQLTNDAHVFICELDLRMPFVGQDCPVHSPVGLLLGLGSPLEVFKFVVGPASVQMTAVHALWAITNKRFQDKSVHHLFGAGNFDAQITLAALALFQQGAVKRLRVLRSAVPLQALDPSQASDAPVRGNFVRPFMPQEGAPYFVHQFIPSELVTGRVLVARRPT